MASESGIDRTGGGGGFPIRASILRIPRQLIGQWIGASLSAWPREACGMFIGREDSKGLTVQAWLPAKNLLAPGLARTGFRLDPVAFLRAEQQAAATGARVLGYWHSHPAGNPHPSARDWAGDPGFGWQVILPLVPHGPPLLRAWERTPGTGATPAGATARPVESILSADRAKAANAALGIP